MNSEFPGRLIDGHRAFKAGRFQAEQNRYRELADKGQSPSIMVIGCVDSRVSPEVIFDAAPGEILVVRNVANLVPPYETGGNHHGVSASLEFGVCALHVKHIVILGHAFCGGIKALASHAAPLAKSDFIGKWVSQIAPAEKELGIPHPDDRDYMCKLEFASVELSLKNMMTFPFVAEAVEQGALQLHGAYFGVAKGRLLIRNPENGVFEPVDD
jgi:carbonic anhydrase